MGDFPLSDVSPPSFYVGIQPKSFHMVGYITLYEIQYHIFKCKIHLNEEKCIYLPYENSKSPSHQPHFNRPFFSNYIYSQKELTFAYAHGRGNMKIYSIPHYS